MIKYELMTLDFKVDIFIKKIQLLEINPSTLRFKAQGMPFGKLKALSEAEGLSLPALYHVRLRACR